MIPVRAPITTVSAAPIVLSELTPANTATAKMLFYECIARDPWFQFLDEERVDVCFFIRLLLTS